MGFSKEPDEEEIAFIKLASGHEENDMMSKDGMTTTVEPAKPKSVGEKLLNATIMFSVLLLLLTLNCLLTSSKFNNGCFKGATMMKNEESSSPPVVLATHSSGRDSTMEDLEAENSHLHSEISKLRKISIKIEQLFQQYRTQASLLVDHQKLLEENIQDMASQNLIAR
jgi:hypothetical protein